MTSDKNREQAVRQQDDAVRGAETEGHLARAAEQPEEHLFGTEQPEVEGHAVRGAEEPDDAVRGAQDKF